MENSRIMNKKSFFLKLIVSSAFVLLLASLSFLIIGEDSFIGTYYLFADSKPIIQMHFDYTNTLEYTLYSYESALDPSSFVYYGTWQYKVAISKIEPDNKTKIHTIDCRYIDPFRNNGSTQIQFYYQNKKLISYSDSSLILEKA